MIVKLIAMDMDGTLLQSDNTISEATKQALLDVQKQGVRLVLASGRSYRKLLSYALELEMNTYGGYLIEVNGTALYNVATNERQVHSQLKESEIKEIFSFLKNLDLEILILQDDGIYDYIPDAMMPDKIAYRKKHNLSEDHPWTAGAFAFIADNRIGYPKQYQVKQSEDIPKYANKFAVCHFPDILAKYYPYIKEALQEHYWVGLTSPGWLEIMPKGVTKGKALSDLAATLNIELDHIMAFGDGENDIEMLQAVKYGFVMENALHNVKEYGYAICDNNNHDGIAKTLETMILSKRDEI